MESVLHTISYVLRLPLIPVGKTQLTVGLLLYMLIMFYLLVTVSRSFRQRAFVPLLSKTNLDAHVQSSVIGSCYYITLAIGTLLILNTAGIDFTSLTVVIGALGLGISLGLQMLAKNMAGGFMIIFEKPIRIGDRIQIGDTVGSVTNIALRATTVRTEDGTDVTVPNADFMSNKIINWSSPPKDFRISVPVIVPSNVDIEQVKEILLQIANSNPLVLSEPAADVLLDSFDDERVKLVIKASTKDFAAATGQLKSALNFALYPKLRELIGETEKQEQKRSEKNHLIGSENDQKVSAIELSSSKKVSEASDEMWHNKINNPGELK